LERGRKIRGGGLSIVFSFPFPFYFICQPSKGGGGARRPHRDGDLRRIRSGGEKGFVICCHDLYRSNAEMMKQKTGLEPKVSIWRDTERAYP